MITNLVKKQQKKAIKLLPFYSNSFISSKTANLPIPESDPKDTADSLFCH